MRPFWIQIHLWLGLTLGAIGIVVGLSGSLLVYDHEFDALFNPQRYAVSGTATRGFGEYAMRVHEATDGKARPFNIRLPEKDGMPVVANARGRDGPQLARLFLDPPTGRVLDAVPGGGFFGWLHRFHENLALREYSGREIVGAVGIAMLISSLSGLYLWWPARGRFREALAMRPGLRLSRNLHYLVGFYGLVFLALLSFSGVWLAYVEGGRTVVGWFSPVAPRNVQLAEPRAEGKAIPVDDAVKAARALYPSAQPVSVGFPAGPRGTYRVNLESPQGAISVYFDPASGAVLRKTDPASGSAGDRFLALQRSLHTGEALGAARFLLFLAGLMPALLVATGAMIWLRRRLT